MGAVGSTTADGTLGALDMGVPQAAKINATRTKNRFDMKTSPYRKRHLKNKYPSHVARDIGTFILTKGMSPWFLLDSKRTIQCSVRQDSWLAS
jgi:hypothetical protein